MKLTCKQKFFHPETSFIPGWDFISVTCKRTLKELTVIELRNKNEQSVNSYRQIKKIKNISCAEISNNCNLLIAHIILNNLAHIIRRWIYISRHVTITNFNCKTKNKRTHWGPGPVNTNWGPGPSNTNLGPGPSNTNWGRGWGPGPGPGAGKHKYPYFSSEIMQNIFYWDSSSRPTFDFLQSFI